MKESVIIYVTFGACRHHVSDIGVCGPVNKRMIRFTRNHNTDINSRSACDFQGIQYGFVRYKIRSLNIYMIFCAVNQTQVIVMDRLNLGSPVRWK